MLKTLMLASLIGLLVGTCAGCSTAAFRSYTTRAEQFDRAVTVMSLCGSVRREGSGVLINDHQVLTAYHVAGCVTAQVTVAMFNGRRFAGHVDIADTRADVARVLLDRSPGPIAPITPARVYVGEKVCFQPAVPDKRPSCGEVTKAGSGPHGIEHNAWVFAGNSGSGVYDKRGRLVGIVTQRNRDAIGGRVTAIAPRRWLVTP